MAKTKKKIPAKKKTAKKTFAKKAVAKKSLKKTTPKKVVAKKAVTKKPVKPAPAKAKPKKGPPGLPEHLRDAALEVLDARQAEEIVTVDLTGKSSMADYLIIASGRASRQLSAIAHYLREAFAKLGVTQIRVEGAGEGNWVLIDAGDVIVHLFRPEVRRYYNLESIWDK